MYIIFLACFFLRSVGWIVRASLLRHSVKEVSIYLDNNNLNNTLLNNGVDIMLVK